MIQEIWNQLDKKKIPSLKNHGSSDDEAKYSRNLANRGLTTSDNH